MNVRLQYDTDFLGGVYYDERLQLNNYSVSISMVTKTIDPVETNIAMDRLKFFIGEVLAGRSLSATELLITGGTA